MSRCLSLNVLSPNSECGGFLPKSAQSSNANDTQKDSSEQSTDGQENFRFKAKLGSPEEDL